MYHAGCGRGSVIIGVEGGRGVGVEIEVGLWCDCGGCGRGGWTNGGFLHVFGVYALYGVLVLVLLVYVVFMLSVVFVSVFILKFVLVLVLDRDALAPEQGEADAEDDLRVEGSVGGSRVAHVMIFNVKDLWARRIA
jgi:hypothetical protein